MGKAASALGILLCLAMAGCSTPSEDAPGPTDLVPDDAAVANATRLLPVVPRNLTTDILHLAEPPAMDVLLANHSVLVPKDSMWRTYQWNTTVRSPANITDGSLDFWLRFTGSQVQGGANDPGCTIVVGLVFTVAEAQRAVNLGCGSAGIGVLPPGDHLVHLAAPPGAFDPPVLLPPGSDIRLDVTVYTASASLGTTCYVVSGPGQDSVLRLAGLNATMPASPASETTPA